MQAEVEEEGEEEEEVLEAWCQFLVLVGLSDV